MQRIDAQELTQWTVWMDAEQIGPSWDRFRHAQLLAAAQNGGRFEHKDGRAFIAADFMSDDPWASPAVVSEVARDLHVAQLALGLVEFESAYERPVPPPKKG